MIFEESEGETAGFKRQITHGGLQELKGSPEEIARAEEIRTRLLVEADDILTQLRSNPVLTASQVDTAIVAPEQVSEPQVNTTEAGLNRLRNRNDAAWWITNGARGARQLLDEALREER